jgi:hypothetical protein
MWTCVWTALAQTALVAVASAIAIAVFTKWVVWCARLSNEKVGIALAIGPIIVIVAGVIFWGFYSDCCK